MAVPVQSLMRQSRTSRIASRFNDPLPVTPIPQPVPNQPWITYESLMRSAGRPLDEHTDPMPPETMAGAGGLPEGSGPPDPNTNPSPTVPPGGTPANPQYPPIGEYNPEPTPIPGMPPVTPNWPPSAQINPGVGGNPPNASGISGGNAPRGNYFPTFGGGPYNPSEGGRLGSGRITGGRESFIGGMFRRLAPLAGPAGLVPGLTHTLAEAIRAGQRGRGVRGGPARQVNRQAPIRTSQTVPVNPSGALSPEQYRQRSFGGLNPVGYRDTRGSMTYDARASGLGLMAAQSQHQPTNQLAGQSDEGRTRYNLGLGMRAELINGRIQGVPFEQTFDPNNPLALQPNRGELPATTDPNFRARMNAINARTARRG